MWDYSTLSKCCAVSVGSWIQALQTVSHSHVSCELDAASHFSERFQTSDFFTVRNPSVSFSDWLPSQVEFFFVLVYLEHTERNLFSISLYSDWNSVFPDCSASFNIVFAHHNLSYKNCCHFISPCLLLFPLLTQF